MRILLITQEPPLDPAKVATGNALRARQLRSALENEGHTVRQVWMAAGGGEDTFNSADRLRSLIESWTPDVLVVGYWELLSLLPWDRQRPVVLDFVAPRPLETLFERPESMQAELRRLRVNLAKADLLLVGNAEQKSLLAWWLLEAGFDLRNDDPVRVVPPAGDPVQGSPPNPEREGWTLVAGGVSWPWRDAGAYRETLDALTQQHPERLKCVWYEGRYRLHGEESDAEGAQNDSRALQSYRDYSAFLARNAHIGLELGADHIERRHSQSFRAVDFLRHGLPLVCNHWLPIARLVEQYDAGWTVGGPEELADVVHGTLSDPREWRQRRENAVRLAAEALDPSAAARPLIEWLRSPQRAVRLPDIPSADPVIGVPPLRERLARRYRLVRRIALNRLFARRSSAAPRRSVVIVTRGDLFPTDHGAAVRTVRTAHELANKGWQVHLVTDDRKRYFELADGEFRSRTYPFWLRVLARPLALTKLDHYTRDLPESNAFLYLPLTDGSFFRRTLYVAGTARAAVLQAEFPAYAQPAADAAEVLGLPVVLVEHNVEYERLRAQVPQLTEAQYQRFRAIEIRLGNRCDAVVCVSDNDRQRLAEDGIHPGLLHTIPHGIDLDAFDTTEPRPVREKFGIPKACPILVFHGTFAYPPNREALHTFAGEILPGLEARGIEAHLLAVGHRPPSESLHPRIHLTGSVQQVGPFLKAADLAVVPLREGGGTRMKIIDFFAAGLPVVSTAKGIEGIPIVGGREAIVVDEPEQLCDAIEKLLTNPERMREIAESGRALAEGLDWSRIGERYLEVYSAIAR